jgi:hypothetical protein
MQSSSAGSDCGSRSEGSDYVVGKSRISKRRRRRGDMCEQPHRSSPRGDPLRTTQGRVKNKSHLFTFRWCPFRSRFRKRASERRVCQAEAIAQVVAFNADRDEACNPRASGGEDSEQETERRRRPNFSFCSSTKCSCAPCQNTAEFAHSPCPTDRRRNKPQTTWCARSPESAAPDRCRACNI